MRRIVIAIVTLVAVVGGGIGGVAPASAAEPGGPAQVAACEWNEGQFANGVRIRNRPSFSGVVLGLGYPSHRVLVYSCPTVTDTVWLAVRNLTTGVNGWSQQGLVWRK
jgi:hypothetical protein